MHFVPPKTFSRYQIGKFDSFCGKRGAFLPQILNSANTHRDTIQVLQRQEQELRTRIAKHLSGQVRAPGASADDRLAEQIPGIPNTSALNKRFGSGSALSNVKIITEEVHHLNQMLFTQEPLA